MSAEKRYAGVDIGGTKIAAGIVDAHDAVLARAWAPTPRTGGADVLRAAGDLVAALVADRGPVAAIGVGAPGVIDRARGIVVSATEVLPGWAGAEVAGCLGVRFGLPVVVDNDVRAAALGEAVAGAGAGFGELLVASVGTGVGGAFVTGGRLRHGPHETGGEIAHLAVGLAGPIPCGCGRRDHLEAHCSGPAIVAAYRGAASDVPLTGAASDVPLTEVAVRAAAGEPDARLAIAEAAGLLGRVLAGFVCAVDVDAVVITGGVSRIGDLFLGPLHAAFADRSIPGVLRIPVLPGALGGDAPLIGAARLAAAGRQ